MEYDVFDLTVAVPAYGRVYELRQLLNSIINQEIMPREVLICEDMSPQREEIKKICAEWLVKFSKRNSELKYVENDKNLGYDANVRKLFEESSGKFVMLMGNDDALLPNCIKTVRDYFLNNPGLVCVSRSFTRFTESPDSSIGVSSVFNVDTVVSHSTHSSKYVFRLCGFVGGLIFDRDWARSKSSDDFDGTLYYQIYLAALAYCERGIGYISTSIVAGRSGNPPLFGVAGAEKSVHIPGSYTPKGRAKMWESVLNISKVVGDIYSIDLVSDIRSELAGRQAFHVFEMLAGKSLEVNIQLKNELRRIGLFYGVIPHLLFSINAAFGNYSKIFYAIIRKIYQRG